MQRILFILISILVPVALSAQAVQKKVTKKPFNDYSYYVSSKLKKGEETTLLIGFPTVKGGNGHVFNYFKQYVEDKGWILVSPNYMPGNRAKKSFYPVNPATAHKPTFKFVKKVRGHFKKKYKLTKKSVYFGFSAGGRAAMWMAMAFPEKTLAALVFCSGGLSQAYDGLVQYGDVGKQAGPTLMGCGTKDTQRYQEMKKTVKKWNKRFKRDAQEVYYKGVGHYLPTAASADSRKFIEKHMNRLKKDKKGKGKKKKKKKKKK